MTPQQTQNGQPKTERDEPAAYACQLACEAAMMPDDWFGVKEAVQGEADRMAMIVAYRKAMGVDR